MYAQNLLLQVGAVLGIILADGFVQPERCVDKPIEDIVVPFDVVEEQPIRLILTFVDSELTAAGIPLRQPGRSRRASR